MDFLRTKAYLIVAFGFHFQLKGEKIIVKSNNDLGLNYAYIHNLANGNWSITNNRGFAHLPSKTQIDDTLKIERYGYSSTFCIYKGRNILITLSDKPLLIDSVEVIKYSYQKENSEKNITVQKKKGYKHISHKEFLERLPGVQIRSLGGPGSINTVSLNGGPTSQTRVTINGFDLTNAQSGVTDLSQLPKAFINEARLVISGEKLISSGAQNGVLELKNQEDENSISRSIGSFDSRQTDVNLSWFSKDYNASFLIGNYKTEGDYEVSWKGKTFNRANNYFYQSYGSFQFTKKVNPSIFIKSFSLITNQKRGVPGLLWSPLKANHSDNLRLFASSINWLNSLGKGFVSYFLKISDDRYNNAQYNIESDNHLRSSTITLLNPILKKRYFKSAIKVKIEKNYLKTKTIEHRNYFSTISSSSTFSTENRINILFTFQKNYSEDLYDQNTNSITLVYNLKSNEFLNSISLSSSSHFRYPTFNDLYWQPGGNPLLKPETGKNFNINMKSNSILNGEWSLDFFNSRTYNLIQWRPIQSYWQAENINDVTRRGVSAYITQNNKYFKLKISLGITDAFSEIEEQRLRYTPKKIGTLFLEKDFKGLSISTNTHYISEMISAYSYPKNNMIPENSVTSIHLSQTLKYNLFDLNYTTSLNNIFNEKYESSKGYPEPRKNFSITITLSQKKD